MSDTWVVNTVSIILVLCALAITFNVYNGRIEKWFERQTEGETLNNVENVNEWGDIAKRGHRIGSSNPTVTIIEFFDYQCSICARMNPILDSLVNDYQERIAIYRLHLPSTGPVSYSSAIASECAARQNKFDSFHQLLFDHYNTLHKTPLDSLAVEAGIADIEKFEECVIQRKVTSSVEEDLRAARKHDIDVKPTLIINGKIRAGYISESNLRKAIGLQPQ